jgi:DHA1 family inner membrane transport protein
LIRRRYRRRTPARNPEFITLTSSSDRTDAAPAIGPEPAPAQTPMVATAWGLVWLLVLSGTAMALHIGKVPPALPALRAGLGISLETAGWLVSLVNLIGAFGGMAIALTADRFGYGRLIVGGALLATVASIAAPLAGTVPVLLVCRFLEGLGFILATVSVPPLLLRFVGRGDQRLIMGLWSAYLPAGAGVIMVAAAALPPDTSWHVLWYGAAIASAAVALAIAVTARGHREFAAARASHGVPMAAVREALRTPGLLLLGACFGLYAGSWYAVVGFLPVLQVERLGFDTATAALVNALVVVSNVGGNVAAGWLTHHGVPRRTVIACGAACMALSSLGLFPDVLPDIVRLGLAFTFSAIGGLVPGAVFGGVPRHAPRPALIGVANGLVVQMTNIGSLLGPPITGMLVVSGGWPAAAWYTVSATTGVVIAAIVLGALERKR